MTRHDYSCERGTKGEFDVCKTTNRKLKNAGIIFRILM
jgi:hypothetical protein